MRTPRNRASRLTLMLAASAATSAVVSISAVPALADGPGPGLLPDHARHLTGSVTSVAKRTFVLSSGGHLTTIHYGAGTQFFNGDMRSSRVMLHSGLAVSVQLRAQLRPLVATSVAALPQGSGL